MTSQLGNRNTTNEANAKIDTKPVALATYIMDPIAIMGNSPPKKINRGVVEDMEFPGVSKKQHVEFPPKVTKEKYEKIMWNFRDLGFWPWNFQGI